MKQRLIVTSLGYSSNSGIFANRGDPWTTDREGRRDYGRDDFENTELDAYRARKASTRNPDRIVREPPLREISQREDIIRRHQSKMLDIGNALRLGVRARGDNGGF